MSADKPALTVREAGRRGGKAKAEKHGHEHFAEMGRKGGRANAEKHDHEHFVEIGRKASRARSDPAAKALGPLEVGGDA